MKADFILRNAISVISIVLICAIPASAEEIHVMISGGFSAAYLEIVPDFEGTTKHKIVTSFGPSLGDAPDSIPNRLNRGEPADVVILASASLDDLIRQGKILPAGRVELVRSGIGMAVRAGASKPDIGTAESLRRTLLQAKSIAYSSSASGIYLSTELFPRLGIAGQVLPKSRRVEGERVGAVVARGEVEIGFQQISELLSEPGIDYVGPLPDEMQRITVFAAGIAAGTKSPEAANALIRYLASPAALPAIRKSGLEPARAP